MRLSSVVENYIAHKRSLGMLFNTDAVRLRAYVKAMGDIDIRRVRPAAVRQFLYGVGPVTAYWFSKYHSLNPFYRYAIAHHHVSKNPLPLTKPCEPARFEPYIYTNQDMQRLIDAADSRHRFVWILDPHTVRTLLLLLYGTGLRISEALRLNLDDFDVENRVLTIHETKFFKSRFVPVGEDLGLVLREYLDQQWPAERRTPTAPLLRTQEYERIKRQTAELVFKRLREKAGVARPSTARYQPRLHDFRHTFAVVRLVTWYREGKNVQRLLPHLTTYLGHLRIMETQRYLTMTTELLQQASLCFERYARPEVKRA
ncbi:MAG: tyrosine-type recombinase/integrase [Terriglobales bacterium]|jgi:integrase/recombinase XerD